jgi:hypothetical protein
LEYLTPEDYETAAKNGINTGIAYRRFYIYGWSRERTITEPVKIRSESEWSKLKDRAVVSDQTFRTRIKQGWTPEKAALTPGIPLHLRSRKRGILRDHHLEIAESNGIGEYTVRARIRLYKWSLEDAITIPVGTRRKKKMRS